MAQNLASHAASARLSSARIRCLQNVRTHPDNTALTVVRKTLSILERQFRLLFAKAARTKGITGEILIQLLECRLDNIVYRLGMAPTRAAARQLVSHRHITVDGKVVNIPSFEVKPGMVVAVREKAKSLEVINESLQGFNHAKYGWLEWNEADKAGKLLNVPARAEIPENIKEQLIVELYSK